jgi:hypothetical protein
MQNDECRMQNQIPVPRDRWTSFCIHHSAFCILAIDARTASSSSYSWLIAWGTTRTSPTTLMKLVSPAQRGHDVLVEVAGQAGARALAQVDADVEPLGGDRPLEQPDALGRLEHQVTALGVVELFELGLVRPRRDQQVAVVVRGSG